MDTSNLVSNALRYYDENQEKYMRHFRKVAYVSFFHRKSDMSRDIVYMYDKNGTELYRFHYEVIGIYSNEAKTWQWAWSRSKLPKKTTETSRGLLSYAFDLDHEKAPFLKTELLTSRFRITHPTQIDIHVGLASYLSKKPVIFPYVGYPQLYKLTGVDQKPVPFDAPGAPIARLGKVTEIGENGDDYVIDYVILDTKEVDAALNQEELRQVQKKSSGSGFAVDPSGEHFGDDEDEISDD